MSKPTGAIIEVTERGCRYPLDPIVPNTVRINGVEVYTTGDIEVGSISTENLVEVTITLLASSLYVGAE